ncbi:MULTISPECIES: ABC transporter ATP-binding protein [Paraliobacillus]|uniref:ATP-binding cassette domain-containing protein n=1 Tax=Paraliobacillus TaxID=200903 RepID=UPI000DD4C677|nr:MULTISPECIES: ABC transporter ATP-binding protein [Paraliobacillus]
MSLLAIEQLSVYKNNETIIDNISFEIKKGEWFALVGQSGSGKSVTASAIGRLAAPNFKLSGKILFENHDILTMSKKGMQKIRGKEISYIFQDYQGSFTPFITIGKHFEESFKRHTNFSKKKRRDETIKALHSVELDEALYVRYPFQLSGGQLQRVSIALALLLKPKLLIADEATTALDSVTCYKILGLLTKLQKETKCTILFITHDWRHVRNYADHIAVMKDGEITEIGKKQKIISNPQHSYTKKLIAAAPKLNNHSFEEVK